MDRYRIGIVGGGQLGRMLTEAALPLGLEVTVIDPSNNCPASQAGAEQITAPLHDDGAMRALASRTDVVTWEIEHINAEALLGLLVPVEPSPAMLMIIQDKLYQKRLLGRAHIPVADYVALEAGSLSADMTCAFELFGEKVMVKTRTGGYDGRGNALVTSKCWQESLEAFGDRPLYAERYESFQKELAVIIARDIRGHTIQYPVAETVHRDNICHLVMAPAQLDPYIYTAAQEIGHETVRRLDGAGVFAIELFVTHDDRVLVNEIAPRVHNSGHHTIEANVTSQFEQHIRAVSGLPLGSAEAISPAAMVNILGERNGAVTIRGLEKVLALPDTHIHLYGKSPTKTARKMGHITVRASTVDEARATALRARQELTI